MTKPSPRVLVTGAAGYVGSILCERLLDAGYHVTAMDNLMYRQHGPFHLCADRRFQFARGDIRDEDKMRMLVKDSDVIIPLAAIVGAPACDRDPVLARDVNVGAIRLVNRLRDRKQLLIYPSTNSGYGSRQDDSFCTEDMSLEPVSLYAQTKIQAEKELLDTPNVISLRFATVFGMSPRMRLDLLVNHFVYAAVTDGYIVLFEKDFRRNYIHIRDVADCYVHCIAHAAKMAGRPYNAGLYAVNLSKEELVLKIKNHVPNFYIHFAPVGTDPDRRNYLVSNERLRDVGFEARRSLDEGIQELIIGYRMMGPDRFRNV